MIFEDTTCEAGIDSRTLDIHVRLALPDFHQQKRFRCREHITFRSRSVPNVSPMVGRRSQSSLVPPYGIVQLTFNLQQLNSTQTSPC